jgi:NAD+ kinase
MPKRIGVVAKRDSAEVVAVARRICGSIENSGFSVQPELTLGKRARIPGGKPIGQMRVDLIVTVGGDGTVLKAVREMPEDDIPILGVNMGRRGYLTEVDPSGFDEALARWSRGEFQLEKQWKLSVFRGDELLGEGLNEALMTPSVPAKMLSVEITLGARKFYSARADGVIVSTPTGSTAHSFSAGGPIIESSLNAFVLAFIAPLQPVHAIVVPSSKSLRVKVDTPSPDANVSIDGKVQVRVKLGEHLSFRKSPNNALFVRFGDSFLSRSLRRLAPEKENV